MTEIPVYALGAIVAATITASFSFIGLILAKEQKVSEFRQAWIDELRSDLATIAAFPFMIHHSFRFRAGAAEKLWEDIADHLAEATKADARVFLRLNPDEPETADLMAAIRNMNSKIEKREHTFEELTAAQSEIKSKAAVIIKKEWRRVKRGELTYVIAKWVSLGLIVFSAVMLVWAWPKGATLPTQGASAPSQVSVSSVTLNADATAN